MLYFKHVAWLVVFSVLSIARPFRDGTLIALPYEGHEARFYLIPSIPGIEPGPSRGSPLHNRCAMPAPLCVATFRNKLYPNRSVRYALRILLF